jgi:tetratricopeptide (TPR) repeat protein
MAKQKKDVAESSVENVEGALSKTERYIEENQKSLTIILIVVFVLFGGYYGYKRLYLAPKEKEAKSQIFVAEEYFEADSFNLAIMGDGNNPGLQEVIDDYGITKTADLAHYYKGISNLRLGNYDQAIDDLKDFDGDDEIVAALSLGAIGDAYVQLEDLDRAANYYKRAASYSDNQFTAPIYLKKLGLLYEYLEEYKKALDAFNKIKSEYPESAEERSIVKYITRVETKMQD